MDIHFGDWLAEGIGKRKISQAEFARRGDGPPPTVRPLGKSPDEIRTKLRQAYFQRGDKSMSVPLRNRPGQRMVMRPVQIINGVSASRFVEKTNLDYPPGFADYLIPAPT